MNETTKEPKISEEQKLTGLRDIVDIFESIAIAIVAAMLILTLVFRTGFVTGSSMDDTMHENDRYVISNLFYTPKQGDIIVFESPIDRPNAADRIWVKRVIATEGQSVYIDPNDHKVYVDGVALDEPYLTQLTDIHGENPVTVPEGHIYVMGDNRLVSHDSRYDDVGCIDTRRILGKVIFRFYPFNKIGAVK